MSAQDGQGRWELPRLAAIGASMEERLRRRKPKAMVGLVEAQAQEAAGDAELAWNNTHEVGSQDWDDVEGLADLQRAAIGVMAPHRRWDLPGSSAALALAFSELSSQERDLIAAMPPGLASRFLQGSYVAGHSGGLALEDEKARTLVHDMVWRLDGDGVAARRACRAACLGRLLSTSKWRPSLSELAANASAMAREGLVSTALAAVCARARGESRAERRAMQGMFASIGLSAAVGVAFGVASGGAAAYGGAMLTSFGMLVASCASLMKARGDFQKHPPAWGKRVGALLELAYPAEAASGALEAWRLADRFEIDVPYAFHRGLALALGADAERLGALLADAAPDSRPSSVDALADAVSCLLEAREIRAELRGQAEAKPGRARRI